MICFQVIKHLKSLILEILIIHSLISLNEVIILDSYTFDSFIYYVCVLHGIQFEPFEL